MVKPTLVVTTVLATVLIIAAACSGSNGRQAKPAPASSVTTTTASRHAGPAYRPARLAGHIAEPAVTESSGLVASRLNPPELWTHNDSGGGPIVYCLSPTGEPCGSWTVSGASATDWEDIAIGPGPDFHRPWLYLGDIGDNARQRTSIVVYRAPEPEVPPGAGAAKAATTGPAEGLRLAYPDGAHDAEALMVHPVSGDLYVVTKDAEPKVYKATAPLSASHPTALKLVATLPVTATPFDRITGGDISPDGRHVVLSNYFAGEELSLPAEESDFDAIWSQSAQTVDLGARDQGESVAYRLDGDAVLATSEGAGSPVYETRRN